MYTDERTDHDTVAFAAVAAHNCVRRDTGARVLPSLGELTNRRHRYSTAWRRVVSHAWTHAHFYFHHAQ